MRWLGPSATLRELVALVRGGGNLRKYTDGCPLPPEVCDRLEPPWFAREALVPQLWMGVGPEDRPTTLLHRDVADGILAQVVGTKRVVLYSPDQSALLYPFANFNGYQQCWVDNGLPAEKMPRYREAEPVEVVLEPGDVLINPAGWFHRVYAIGENLSVSYMIAGDSVHPTGAACSLASPAAIGDRTACMRVRGEPSSSRSRS